jgi:hypothetical protein
MSRAAGSSTINRVVGVCGPVAANVIASVPPVPSHHHLFESSCLQHQPQPGRRDENTLAENFALPDVDIIN